MTTEREPEQPADPTTETDPEPEQPAEDEVRHIRTGDTGSAEENR